MLTDRDLRELLSFQAQAPVLSIYLNLDPAEGNAEAHKLRLRSMLKEVDLPEDEAAILRYFDHEHDWSGRSIALFSCQPEGFFRLYSLAVPVRSRIRTNNRPYVKPLADLLDAYGGYGVVLIDKQGARLFSFHLGELKEQEGIMGEAVRHTKRGGGSQTPGRRSGVAGQTNYEDEVTGRNAREAVEFATHFFTEHNIRRILIGGTDDNIALFRSQLPKAWQSLVVGVFPMSMTASHHDVHERAMEVAHKADIQRECKIIDAVVTSSAKGRGGVIHLDDTLNAVHDGRVQMLVVQEGFRAPGCRCTSCGHLSAHHMESCPFCGSGCEDIEDAVELAVRKVMQAGGDVEFIHTEYMESDFNGIGALLRY